MAQPQRSDNGLAIPSTKNSSHKFELANAVRKGELSLNMSQLLGCDYVFIGHEGSHRLLDINHINDSLAEAFDLLATGANQAVVILVDTRDEHAQFFRQEFNVADGRIERTRQSAIVDGDQAAFMRMMLDCSTAY